MTSGRCLAIARSMCRRSGGRQLLGWHPTSGVVLTTSLRSSVSSPTFLPLVVFGRCLSQLALGHRRPWYRSL